MEHSAVTELQFQHVDRAYGRTLAARDVCFRIPSKSFGVVVGPSGCGKSSLLSLAAGLDEPTNGYVFLGGREVRGIRDDVALLFQNYNLFLTDPYEQLSDAYTFMELRRARPSVGDHLYSTLRRPMLSLERDDAGHGIDLLRHDYWWTRDKCREALADEAKTNGIASPLRCDWPYALNVFARTRIGEGGDLIDDPVATTQGTRIELRTRFDVVVAVMAAGTVSPAIDVMVNPA